MSIRTNDVAVNPLLLLEAADALLCCKRDALFNYEVSY